MTIGDMMINGPETIGRMTQRDAGCGKKISRMISRSRDKLKVMAAHKRAGGKASLSNRRGLAMDMGKVNGGIHQVSLEAAQDEKRLEVTVPAVVLSVKTMEWKLAMLVADMVRRRNP